MAYHTGHRLDCDLSVDPIECFCGDYSALPPVDWSKVDFSPIKIENEYTLDMDKLFADVALQMIHKRTQKVINGTRRN